jgi:stage V sporulation protein G
MQPLTTPNKTAVELGRLNKQQGNFMQLDDSETGAVSITVLSVKPMRSGRLFAPASVELDFDGVRVEIHGIRALRVDPVGTRIELPKFRDANGLLRAAVVLPEEVRAPIGDLILDALIDRGLATRRFSAAVSA